MSTAVPATDNIVDLGTMAFNKAPGQQAAGFQASAGQGADGSGGILQQNGQFGAQMTAQQQQQQLHFQQLQHLQQLQQQQQQQMVNDNANVNAGDQGSQQQVYTAQQLAFVRQQQQAL
ncbi:hypothetical protein LPJ66_007616, partial [Kickxella alabastrina]